jgi:cyanophycinase
MLVAALLALSLNSTEIGPPKGALVIVGGGNLGKEIVGRFIELAGGVDAPMVLIPTAEGAESYDGAYLAKNFLIEAGCTQVTLLHTKDRAEADSAAFVEPLRKARGVWFTGGRQWRLVDSYLHTRTQKEIEKVLKRGGVVGGTSAGATIIGSYLVRGAREGNTIMMAPGYEEGMGLLRNSAIDQHLLKRNRERDLIPVIEKHPSLLGIGIDESTAVIVKGNGFEVTGESKVAIYEAGKDYYFLNPGDRFDLAKRTKLP